MAKKRRGDITKKNIMHASRKLFYSNGYTNTKIQMICEASGVSRNLINYHFSTKQDILITVMRNYLEEVYLFVCSNVEEDSLLRYFVFNKVYYNMLTFDENIKRFIFEVLSRNDRTINTYDNFTILYSGIFETYNANMSENVITQKKISIFGANRELILNYLKQNIFIEFSNLIEYLTCSACKMMGVPNIVINDYLKKHSKYLSNLDCSEINFCGGA